MQIISKTLQKNQMDIEIEVPADELQKFVEKAVIILGETVKIAGFRAGKVPFDILKQNLGEMAIYEKAAELAIEKTYPAIIKDENIEALGAPQISILKLAPGNLLLYKASISLVPHVKLCDYHKIKIKRNEIIVEEKKLEKILKDLQKMQVKEKLTKNKAKKEDKIVLDMDLFLEKVPVDGGQAKNHAVYLNEPYYIPGFAEQLVGLGEGETKEFTLPFPKEYFQKNLAGKNVDFKVKILSVFELELPPINDDFAKTLGQPTLLDLKNILKDNLRQELEEKEELRVENELLKEIAKKSEFEDIPETLIHSETHKMVHELKDGVTRQGMDFKIYLQNIKKTEEDLEKSFISQATDRIKAALVIKEAAIMEKIEATDAEIEEEVQKFAEIYKDEPTILERIRENESEEYLKNVVINRKTLNFLKKIAINQ
jgi:trigger factor